jgi:hypothetical protein
MKSWEELSRHEQLQSIHWDIYKDVHGIRPRHVIYSAMSEEDLVASIQDLEIALGFAEEQRRVAEEKACHDFEMRIQSLMGCGAHDRAMAIRWLMEAEGAEDPDYLCYLLGLPYGYLSDQKVTT